MQVKQRSQKAGFTHAANTQPQENRTQDEDRSADNNDEQTSYFERGE
jgi:hypothetical protein